MFSKKRFSPTFSCWVSGVVLKHDMYLCNRLEELFSPPCLYYSIIRRCAEKHDICLRAGLEEPFLEEPLSLLCSSCGFRSRIILKPRYVSL
jgi:hypothetical protein